MLRGVRVKFWVFFIFVGLLVWVVYLVCVVYGCLLVVGCGLVECGSGRLNLNFVVDFIM